ncbi:MAG: hypothetical protein JST48_03590 [Bacteroidetes bacterium]|nr:hypothetical protein [Bacteroidota bacterium]
MKEANLLKYYFVRYFFLAFALMQVIAAAVLLLRFQDSPKNRFAIFIFFSLAMILISIHFLFFTKVKRVAMSKTKIAVIGSFKVKQYDWDEVKDLKLMPFLNMYSLKIKGKKKRIYFLPVLNTQTLFGLHSDKPDSLKERLS